MMAGVTDRVATALTCFALCDETGVHTFTGERSGTIAESPRGDDFGWNPIFIPDDSDRTWGEMSIEESRTHSMRRLALEKVQTFLETHYT
jgi:XTP/dITP diphosphohydrolase